MFTRSRKYEAKLTAITVRADGKTSIQWTLVDELGGAVLAGHATPDTVLVDDALAQLVAWATDEANGAATDELDTLDTKIVDATKPKP